MNRLRLRRAMALATFPSPVPPWSPADLFAEGQVGFTNQLTLGTLYTDTAGTTLAVNSGDTIALGLDQSGNSNDMVQATAAARPVYGQMPVSGVRNLLTYSEDISNAAWAKITCTTPDFETLIQDNASIFALGQGYIRANDAITKDASAQQWTVGGEFESAGFDRVQLVINDASSAPDRADVTISLVDGSVATAAAGRGTFSGASSTVESLGGGRYRITLTTTTGTETGINIRIMARDSVATQGNGVDGIKVTKLQLNQGGPKDYQKVTSSYDVTQSGVPSVPIAYLDTSDDNFSWTLPAGTYHLFVAGDLGCYFDTVAHAGGEFTVGPTSWTGGPTGAITTLIGQRHVIMPVIRDEAFTQFEKAQLVAYAMARGGGEVWNAGSELVTNGDFATDTDWTKGTGWTIGSGVAAKAPGAGSNIDQAISLIAASYYLTQYTLNHVAGNFRARFAGGTNVDGVTISASGVQRELLAAVSGNTSFRIIGTSTDSEGTIDNASVKRLTQSSTPT